MHDNLRTHHSIELKKYCISNNINLIYTLPYSPEFKPIEETFSEVRRIFTKVNHRKHKIRDFVYATKINKVYFYHSELILSINKSINNCNKEHLKKHFNHSLNIIYTYR